jgi:glycosyltransferase involved in cell wall biosynthesis
MRLRTGGGAAAATVAQRSTGDRLRVAYLVNQYPRTSHSFIRREILALESLGVEVLRYSLRGLDEPLASEVDRQELARTRMVLEVGAAPMLLAVLRAVLTRPRAFLRAVGQALQLGWGSDRGVLRHLAYLVEACVLVGWLEEGGVQHLHAHFGTNPAAVALLCHILGGPAYSFTIHGPQEYDRPAFLSLDRKVQQAAFVAAISEFGRSQILRWSRHEDWDKVEVVHCGVPSDLLGVELQPPPAARRLVCIARLAAAKGQLLLLDAAAQLAAEGLEFEVVLGGDGPLRQTLEAEVERRGLGRVIRLAGWMSEAQVRDAIVGARAMVLPSFAEGLPVVVMESLALGRPVIATAIAGVPELVRSGVTGWLIPPGSVDSLVTAMREAFQAAPEELARMGRTGSALVAQHHDARREAAKLKARFEAVVSRPAG